MKLISVSAILFIENGTTNKYQSRRDIIQQSIKSVIPVIESVYDSLTESEKIIADFFIRNQEEDLDFSSSHISQLIHVSEASLTRFSKKCGFTGYREFIFTYKKSITALANSHHTQLTQSVLADYEEILSKTHALIDDDQVNRVIEAIIHAKRVYFYGVGSSGLVAEEMKSRFMRLGLLCDAFTDADLIKINSSLLDEECVVIALSISSETPAILTGLEQARNKNAKIILLTANRKEAIEAICDEVVMIASRKNLDFGNRITPQFPLLIMVDILYAYLLDSDMDTRKKIFTKTLFAFDDILDEKGK